MTDFSAATPPLQTSQPRWLATILVAGIIAVVVLGGVGLDNVIAAPSAGIVTIGGSVTITAAPGWVLDSAPGDTSDGIELQKAYAVLTAQVVSTSYAGDSEGVLAAQERSLTDGSAQISYSEVRTDSASGRDTTSVMFEATIVSGRQSGVVDGELICMVVRGNAVVLLVGAPQGDLDPMIDDIATMITSVGVAS